MKAVVYDASRQVSVKDVPDAPCELPTAVLVQITSTTSAAESVDPYGER